MKKIYYGIILLLTFITTYRYVDIYYQKHEYYYEEFLKRTNKIVYGLKAPRGRILDRNGIVLVDNESINVITYHKQKNNKTMDIVIELLELIDVEPASIEKQLDYYIETNDTDNLLTEEEKDLYNRRKISLKEIENLKKSRIELNYTEDEQKQIRLYYMLEDGYYYDLKTIQENVSDEICAKINEKNISGLLCEQTYQRKYNYDTFNELYGTVGKITEENKDYYLNQGYSLNDEVGLSYLEKQYDSYLRGEKAKYLVNNDNSLTLLSSPKQGNDIYLSLDIILQQKINEILRNNIDKSEKYKNTKYYNRSYVIVSDPNTGEIIASTGLSKINDNYIDVSKDILLSSFTVGSIIKGASHTVGYQNNLIDVGKKINDSCVKLYQVPMKCSHKKLGYIDDVTALKTSSNYYQFITAIKSTNNKYKNNMKLNTTKENFDLYRNTFEQFGLGSSTGIDLENESLGIRGNNYAPDLLLNLSIGQYDTYTPLQLTNYINTIATSGNRYALHYLLKVQKKDQVLYEYPKQLLNKVENNRFDRIIEGFKQVMIGTGAGYTDLKYKPAGKTGTSEIVYSKNVMTVNQSYAMFAPYDNPKYSIVIISPNLAYNDGKDNYIAPTNRYIAKEVTKLIFEA